MIEYGLLEKSEAPALIRLYEQLNPGVDGSVPEGLLADILERSALFGIQVYVARDAGRIVGSCYICVIPNLSHNGRSIGYIENVVTDENYRRRGIGRELIGRALAWAKAQNCYKAVLESGIARTGAHAFYRALGFDEASHKTFEIRF
ncbi:MAG: GNAT family N-acetyltransferase [Fusobacteriaceae bacterium]|nr:GNAT family N-acetyltransferase [Fusobacteriaceae bacterium]